MIEKPDLRDETIISTLRKHYSIPVLGIEFLPVGNDAFAWVYRVDAENQSHYFLKIRKENSSRTGVLVPYFLRDTGIKQVLAPLAMKGQELWIRVEDFLLILYPFVNGSEAMKVGMSDSQWKEFGSILKRIHDTKLPSDVTQNVRQETFIPNWSRLAKEFYQQVNAQNFDDPYQKELAAFWKENNTTIWTVLERAELIGKQLQEVDFEFVLCHADIHTANILLTPD